MKIQFAELVPVTFTAAVQHIMAKVDLSNVVPSYGNRLVEPALLRLLVPHWLGRKGEEGKRGFPHFNRTDPTFVDRCQPRYSAIFPSRLHFTWGTTERAKKGSAEVEF